jgi:hypothetical protein
MNDRAVNALSWAVVILAVVAFVDPWLDYCADLIALGVALPALGALFLFAYVRANGSRVLRFLLWFCEHLTAPAGRGMAFFWCLFFVLLGIVALVQGLGLFEVQGFSRGRLVFDGVHAEPTTCRPH